MNQARRERCPQRRGPQVSLDVDESPWDPGNLTLNWF